jgi:hypothetical protein
MTQNLEAVKSEPKNGNMKFHSGKSELEFTVENFWSWAFSNLLNNVTRGCLAEFIVAKALKTAKDVRNPWAAYDLDLPMKSGKPLKIEVKSAAYFQSWEQDKLSTIQFDIKKTKKLDSEASKYVGKPKRHAEVYVFALLKEKDDKTKVNPLDVHHWAFYVVPTVRLNKRTRSQHSITLKSLEVEMDAKPVNYSDLRNVVLVAAKQQRSIR